jgi:hypothetical protein
MKTVTDIDIDLADRDKALRRLTPRSGIASRKE